MSRNNGDEILHLIPIAANQMLHDGFEREYINIVNQHVENMDGFGKTWH